MVKSMRKFTYIIFSILFVVAVSAVSAGICNFECNLECLKYGPKTVVTDAGGNVTFHLDENRQELHYKLYVENIKGAYMAHLHVGPCNKQGPIAVWLYPFNKHNAKKRAIEEVFSGILAEEVIRPEDLQNGITFSELVESMRQGNAYVNVHTTKYIFGEVQGQIDSSQL